MLANPISPEFRANTTGTLVVIDPLVDDLKTLVNGVISGAEVIVLDPNRDGVAQITKALQDRASLSAVHLVCHGSPGCLKLGNSQLCLDTLEHYSNQLQQWTHADVTLDSPRTYNSQQLAQKLERDAPRGDAERIAPVKLSPERQ